MPTLIKNKKGFTLVELMVSIGIFLILIAISTDYIITGLKSSRINEEQEEAVKNAKNATEVITKEIREARQSERGDYLLNVVNPQEISFYSDVDNDIITEKVRYFISNRVLVRGVIEPSGVPLEYNIANEATSSVANYINNNTQAMFTYYDTNNNLIADPTTNKTLIRLIKLLVIVNVNPLVLPGDYNLETDVQIRNLKDNL